MALFSFTKAILSGKPIELFNHGDMRRDYTYVDDIVQGVLLRGGAPAAGRPVVGRAPVVGLTRPCARVQRRTRIAGTVLADFVTALEDELGMKAQGEEGADAAGRT